MNALVERIQYCIKTPKTVVIFTPSKFEQYLQNESLAPKTITVAGEQLATVFGVPGNLITEADFTIV